MTDFIQSGLRTIEMETNAVGQLSSRISDSFVSACEIILRCTGRVIVTGMGKSGHIGSKIAATLASTGTPAFFVHPGEANHGDLGMITKNDVVLAISNSGTTTEIVTLLPLIIRLGIPLISMTGNSRSQIAQASVSNLDVSVSSEACPLNLAPTTSTTVTLVMGDALSIALLEARGFTAQDFAFSHPGGALGRKLLIKVQDIMHKSEQVPSVSIDGSLQEALLEMTAKGLGMTTVISNENKLVGIFTDGDLKRLIQKKRGIEKKIIKNFMTKNPFVVEENMLASEILLQMNRKKITSACVYKKGNKRKIIGVLHIHNLLHNLK